MPMLSGLAAGSEFDRGASSAADGGTTGWSGRHATPTSRTTNPTPKPATMARYDRGRSIGGGLKRKWTPPLDRKHDARNCTTPESGTPPGSRHAHSRMGQRGDVTISVLPGTGRR